MIATWKELLRTKVLYAILLGQLMLNLPILIFHFGGIPFIVELEIAWYWRLLIVLGHLGLGFIISFRYWQFMITRWRLKAFSIVPQEHWLLLKDWAERSKLLHGDDSAWNDFELRTFGEHEVLSEIDDLVQHFESMEQTKLNLESPWRLEFHLKKGDAIMELVLRLFFFFFGIYLVLKGDWEIGGIITVLMLLIGNKPRYFKFGFSQKPVLGLSQNGFDLELPTKKYIPWSELIDLEFDEFKSLTLHYYENGVRREQRVKYESFDVPNAQKFLRLLKVYWRRYSDYQFELYKGLAGQN